MRWLPLADAADSLSYARPEALAPCRGDLPCAGCSSHGRRGARSSGRRRPRRAVRARAARPGLLRRSRASGLGRILSSPAVRCTQTVERSGGARIGSSWRSPRAHALGRRRRAGARVAVGEASGRTHGDVVADPGAEVARGIHLGVSNSARTAHPARLRSSPPARPGDVTQGCGRSSDSSRLSRRPPRARTGGTPSRRCTPRARPRPRAASPRARRGCRTSRRSSRRTAGHAGRRPRADRCRACASRLPRVRAPPTAARAAAAAGERSPQKRARPRPCGRELLPAGWVRQAAFAGQADGAGVERACPRRAAAHRADDDLGRAAADVADGDDALGGVRAADGAGEREPTLLLGGSTRTGRPRSTASVEQLSASPWRPGRRDDHLELGAELAGDARVLAAPPRHLVDLLAGDRPCRSTSSPRPR